MYRQTDVPSALVERRQLRRRVLDVRGERAHGGGSDTSAQSSLMSLAQSPGQAANVPMQWSAHIGARPPGALRSPDVNEVHDGNVEAHFMLRDVDKWYTDHI